MDTCLSGIVQRRVLQILFNEITLDKQLDILHNARQQGTYNLQIDTNPSESSDDLISGKPVWYAIAHSTQDGKKQLLQGEFVFGLPRLLRIRFHSLHNTVACATQQDVYREHVDLVVGIAYEPFEYQDGAAALYAAGVDHKTYERHDADERVGRAESSPGVVLSLCEKSWVIGVVRVLGDVRLAAAHLQSKGWSAGACDGLGIWGAHTWLYASWKRLIVCVSTSF